MTITNVAALLLRFFGVYLFFDVVLVLTELPTEVYTVIATQIGYIRVEREVVLIMSLVRLGIYAVGGICCIAFSRPLGKFFAKGLDGYF